MRPESLLTGEGLGILRLLDEVLGLGNGGHFGTTVSTSKLGQVSIGSSRRGRKSREQLVVLPQATKCLRCVGMRDAHLPFSS